MDPISEKEIRSSELLRRVVPLSCADLDAIETIGQSSAESPWNRQDFAYFLSHECNGSRGLLLETEGSRLLGAFCLGLLSEKEFDIAYFMTHPKLRQLGLAKELMASYLGQSGVSTIVLEVSEGNIPAVSLYRTCGFETVSRRVRYYKGKYDALRMKWTKDRQTRTIPAV